MKITIPENFYPKYPKIYPKTQNKVLCGRTRTDLKEIIGNITDEIFQKYIKEQTEK